MHKLLNLKAAAACLSVFPIMVSPAVAQGTANSQLQSSGVKYKFDASDIAEIMGEFGIATALSPYEGNGAAAVLAETQGSARFVISLFNCDNAAEGVGCQAAVIYTGMPNAGVAYDDINTFNASADVTRAVNIAEQNIIMFGRQIFFAGGIGRDNFKVVSALFLNDMQKFMESQLAAGAAVSLKVEPPIGAKTDNIIGEDAGVEVAGKPAAFAGAIDNALTAAISNTWHVSFTSPAE